MCKEQKQHVILIISKLEDLHLFASIIPLASKIDVAKQADLYSTHISPIL